jgi:hypothetical protein
VGEELTRWTIRIALLLYAAATLTGRCGRAAEPANRRARLLWTLGLMAYLAHIASAFHFTHHWSHAAAYRDTARQTAEIFGWHWGGGLYVNYAFTLLWPVDAACWWRSAECYRRRPGWMVLTLHGVFLFMIFNATVVFAAGAVRWLGLLMCVALMPYCWNCRSIRSPCGPGRL